jgi:hypothetical protein
MLLSARERSRLTDYLTSDLKVVGTRPIRADGVDKVIGLAVFAADTRAAGMLWGKIERSPHAHAKILPISPPKPRAALEASGLTFPPAPTRVTARR